MIEAHEYIGGVRRVVARTEDRGAALRAACDALARALSAKNEGAAMKGTMLTYTVDLHPMDGTEYMVTFPDFPNVNSAGESVDDALRNAVDAIESAFILLRRESCEPPVPSKPKEGRHTVNVVW